ncbi:hypothetical protein QC762_115520 [Podospora pseudocomata]|uniref:Uncharacterized protein n=1 Tax=Podospora pseudocomata TaxID=2093779 RepID=A0ABR0GWA6_9PEZI|nr:hypothetical protein QC762_115520 [Podospora pseudocomata]
MSNLLNTDQTQKTADQTAGGITAGISGAGKTVTSTLGNTLGGIANTAGGVVGSAGRGLGDTVNSVTGETGRPIGDGLKNITGGIEKGVQDVSQGVKDTGEWKTSEGSS